MTTRRYVVCSLTLFCGVFLLRPVLFAQTGDSQIANAVLQRDSLFWLAYNSCDTASFRGFFTDDVEFYHDKGGITKGLEAVMLSLKKNLCSDDHRMRREAVAGTVNIFPLRNGSVPYGAILTGEHVFYVGRRGKSERVDALAKFAHTWIFQDNSWKMSRILSYDHRPAAYINKRKEVNLPVSSLNRYIGHYRGPSSGEVFVTRGEGSLILTTNGKEFAIYPETETTFFSKDRDLTFEFMNMKTANAKMVVRELGSIVDELSVVK